MFPGATAALDLGRRVRRILVCAAAVALTCSLVLAAAPPFLRAQAHRPDVVLILTDDQPWYQLARMPSVRALLVNEGVRFTRGFVTNPLCCPSRASILTGTFSHTNGIYTNGDTESHGGFEEFDDASTFATWLDGAGYHTGFAGKYLNHYGPGRRYVPPGWDWWAAMDEANGAFYDYDEFLDRDTHDGVAGRIVSHGTARSDYSTDHFADESVRFIRSVPAGEPLLLSYWPYAPHGPATPARRHKDAFSRVRLPRPPNFDERRVADKPRYIRKLDRLGRKRIRGLTSSYRRQLASLLAVDDAVRRIVQALSETGRLHDTMIVFTSDNGKANGEHRWTYKLTPYEESIRVPFVVRYDALGSVGSSGAIVANVDLAPTFADLARTGSPGAEGESLLPLLRGSQDSVRDALLIEHLWYSRGKPVPPTYCAVRTRNAIYVHYARGRDEYYRLRKDPYELRNLIGAPGGLPLLEVLRGLCSPRPPGMPAF